MSFHLSAENVRVDDKHILRARLRREDGSWNDAEIDLDHHLGNKDGMICWDSKDFSHSAERVTYSVEGGGQVPVLRCHLRTEEGEEIARDVNLAERLININGNFQFK